jgi:hypothetical protein
VAIEYLKNKIKNLEINLENTKIFLNMSVHDMRNPTNQIEFLSKQALAQLREYQSKLKEMD